MEEIAAKNLPTPEIKLTSRIVDLTLESFDLEPKANDFNKETITFEFVPEISFNVSSKIMNILFTTSIYSDETKTKKIGVIETKGIFEILNIEEILTKFNGIPNVIIMNLLAVVVSATRGMFVLQTKGTYLEKVIIQMVDIQAFFTPPQNK